MIPNAFYFKISVITDLLCAISLEVALDEYRFLLSISLSKEKKLKSFPKQTADWLRFRIIGSLLFFLVNVIQNILLKISPAVQ